MVYDYTNEINAQNLAQNLSGRTGLRWEYFERNERRCCKSINFPRRDFCNCRKPQCDKPICGKPQCNSLKFCCSCCPWGLLVLTAICRCCR